MSDQAYCVGGDSYPAQGCKSDNRMYDLSDNAWTNKTNAPTTKKAGGDGMATGSAGYINGYLFGGTSECGSEKKTEEYDISGDSWTTKADQLVNNGGKHRGVVGDHIITKDYRYDITNNVWKSGGVAGSDAGYSWVIGGYAYTIIGKAGAGAGSGQVGNKLDVNALTFTTCAAQPAFRQYGCGCEDGMYGYAFAGASDDGSTNYCWSNSNYRYDGEADSWATRTAIGASQMANGTFLIDGSCHSMGGQAAACNGYGTTNYHGRYDNAGNSWTSKTSHPVSGGGQQGFNALANLPPSAPTSLSVSAT